MTVEYAAVLVRYGEIGVKSRQTRRRMSRLLARHIASALREHRIPFSGVRVEFGRIFVETSSAERAATVISSIFGVVSTSPVVVTDATMESILETGVAVARESFRPGLSFAVGARRMGEHSFTSQEIRERLGARILSELDDLNLRVNLSSPEQTIYVEVRDESSYIFTETVPGVGGMPTGSQGPVVCIVTGNASSAVAAYRVIRRGCIPVWLFFDTSGEDSALRATVRSQVQALSRYIYNYDVTFYTVSYRSETIPLAGLGRSMACLLCRRNMLRVAREILHRENADAVVIGDMIGEGLSSGTEQLQTITEAVCGVPVLTPCAGDDVVQVKQEASGLDLSCQIDTCHACGIAAQTEDESGVTLGSIIEAEESITMTSPAELASRSEAVVVRGPRH
ncbi:MAG: THUMP domain-containing protein [Candidatus Thorarchaeota archaeon]